MGAYEHLSSTLYVDSSVAISGDDQSWSTPFKTLKEAIDYANTGTSVNTILVAKGTYYPTGEQSEVNRNTAFAFSRGNLKVIGGYNASTGRRNFVANPTILSGNIGNENIATDNSYHVIVITGVNTDSLVIDGFEITGGYADENTNHLYNGIQVSQRNGGGISMNQNKTVAGNNDKIIVRNSKIYGNTAWFGGGVLAHSGSSLQLINSLVYNNAAIHSAANNNSGKGGGIFTTGEASLTANNSTIANNTAANAGGGIYNDGSLAVDIINTILWGNTTDYRGTAARTINYTITQEAVNGTGNINQDPLFVNAPSHTTAPFTVGDYRLQACSPAINAGTSDTTGLNLSSTDIVGNNRIQFNRIDMGAYESNAQPAAAASANNNATANNMQSENGTTLYGNNCNEIIAAITGSGENPINGATTVKLWVQNSSAGSYVRRHYEITPDNNPEDATGTITLYFSNDDFKDFNLQNPANLLPDADDAATIADRKANIRIEKRNGTSNNNSGLPGSYQGDITTINPDEDDIIWNAVANRWEVTFSVTGFSGFFVKTTETILPLRLLFFTAKEESCSAILNWQTADEVNVSHYEVEQSTDGVNWRFLPSVGMTTAKGRSENDYSVTLPILPSGVRGLYYRLKMIDIDGQYSYSNIAMLNAKCLKLNATLYPNPAKEMVYVNGVSIGDRYWVYDNTGRSVLQGTITKTLQDISTTHLAAGIYSVVVVNTNGEKQVLKLMKE